MKISLALFALVSLALVSFQPASCVAATLSDPIATEVGPDALVDEGALAVNKAEDHAAGNLEPLAAEKAEEARVEHEEEDDFESFLRGNRRLGKGCTYGACNKGQGERSYKDCSDYNGEYKCNKIRKRVFGKCTWAVSNGSGNNYWLRLHCSKRGSNNDYCCDTCTGYS